MIFTLKHESIEKINETEKTIFPKYTSQLINLANQNAQGTRPNVIGQLSELFPEFLCSDEEKNLQGWSEWYKHRYPLAIENATKKINRRPSARNNRNVKATSRSKKGERESSKS